MSTLPWYKTVTKPTPAMAAVYAKMQPGVWYTVQEVFALGAEVTFRHDGPSGAGAKKRVARTSITMILLALETLGMVERREEGPLAYRRRD